MSINMKMRRPHAQPQLWPLPDPPSRWSEGTFLLLLLSVIAILFNI